MNNDNSQRGRVIAFPRTPPPAGAAAAAGRRRPTPATIALLPGSYGIRFTGSRGPNAMRHGFGSGIDDKRRLHVRHREGITMKTIERIIHTVGRFAVGFGSGIALVCAYVIVTTDIGLGPSTVTEPVDAIRLDPVVVTISSGRYDAIRAESAGAGRHAGRRHRSRLRAVRTTPLQRRSSPVGVFFSSRGPLATRGSPLLCGVSDARETGTA